MLIQPAVARFLACVDPQEHRLKTYNCVVESKGSPRKLQDMVIPPLRRILRSFGIGVTSHSNLTRLTDFFNEESRSHFDLTLIKALASSNIEEIITQLKESKSQLRQDLFVLSELKFLKEGFFVEFGATNGFNLSNSWLLEKEYSWKGILVEPGRIWHKELHKNRPKAVIDKSCVWKESGAILKFNETSSAELSTISDHSWDDLHGASRKHGKEYDVNTISLNDLLKKHNAPEHINYLSIDTEGSEFEILNALDFNKYSFDVITCEHNHTAQRKKIYNLLTSNGYVRRLEEISDFDDWYTRK